MKISPKAIELIKHFESCLEPAGNGMLRAYADPAHGWKVPTIGWGTIKYPDGGKVERGDLITQKRADELLAWEIAEKSKGIGDLVTVKLTDNEYGALVSFAYNCGLGNLAKSTLLRKLNQGDKPGASREFSRWNKAGGRVLAGLTRRRRAEAKLFSSDILDFS